MSKWRIILFWSLGIIFLILFWLRGSILLDADFGWHIRMGEIILRQGIPKTDILSYTMPSFPMVDHEWLTNIFLALLFPILGFGGLAVIFAGLAVGSIVLSILDFSCKIADKKGSIFTVILYFLGGLSLYSFVGIRPQVITWFLFSIFVLVLLQKRWQRLFWFLPLLQLLWVNLHGGFAVGVFLVGLVFCMTWVCQLLGLGNVKKEEIISLLVLFVLCAGVTLINPYGVRIWGEIWMQLSDSSLRSNINEWQPAIYFSNLAFWAYLLVFIFFGVRYWRKFVRLYFVQFGCSVFFLLLALSSMRHIPLWIFVSLPVMAKSYALAVEGKVFNLRFYMEKFGGISWIAVLTGVVTGFVLILLPQYISIYETLHNYSAVKVYPIGAVKYLQLHGEPKNIFALYDWNSYILWQLPRSKIFIDGMMPSWRWNYASKRESSYAFAEYIAVLQGKISLAAEIEKYGIDCVVLPADAQSLDDVRREYSISGLERQVKEMGWRVVYGDQTAVVYEQK